MTVESQDDEWAYCTVDRGGEFVSGYVPTSYVSIAEPELLKPAPAKMTREVWPLLSALSIENARGLPWVRET